MQTGDGNIRLSVTPSGIDSTTSEISRLERKISSVADETKKAGEKVNNSVNFWGKATAAFNAAGAALDLVGRASQLVGEQIVKLGQRGIELNGIQSAFQRVGSPEVLRGLREATQGFSSTTSLMERFTTASQGAFSDTQIVDYFERTTLAAHNAGISYEEAYEALSEGLASGNFEALEELGISINEVSESMSNQIGSSRNLSEAWTRLTNAASEAYDQTASSFSQNEELIALIDAISQALNAAGIDWTSLGNTIAIVTVSVVRSVAGMARGIVDGLSSIFTSIQSLFQGGNEISPFGLIGHWLGLDIDADQFSRSLTPVISALNQATDLIDDIETRFLVNSGVAAATEREPILRQNSRRRSSGSSFSSSSSSSESNLDFYDALYREQFDVIANAERELGEIQHERYARQIEDLQNVLELIDRENAARENLRLLDEEARTFEIESRKELIRQQSVADEYMVAQASERRDSYFNSFGEWTGVAVNFGDTISGIFSQISQQQGLSEKEVEKYKRAQGGLLAGFSFVKAAIEGASAISKFANQKYAEGALHIIAAAGFAAAGSLAIKNLGGAASQASIATASFSPSTQPRSKEYSSTSGTNINVYTMSVSDASLGRELNRAQYRSRRSGLDRSMQPSGVYAS